MLSTELCLDFLQEGESICSIRDGTVWTTPFRFAKASVLLANTTIPAVAGGSG